MINGNPLWHVSAIKLWANWSSFNKINGHVVYQYTVSSIINAYVKSLNYPFKKSVSKSLKFGPK